MTMCWHRIISGEESYQKKGSSLAPPFYCSRRDPTLLGAITRICLGRLVAQGQRVLFAGEADFGQGFAAVTISLDHGGVAGCGAVEVNQPRRNCGNHFLALKNVQLNVGTSAFPFDVVLSRC